MLLRVFCKRIPVCVWFLTYTFDGNTTVKPDYLLSRYSLTSHENVLCIAKATVLTWMLPTSKLGVCCLPLSMDNTIKHRCSLVYEMRGDVGGMFSPCWLGLLYRSPWWPHCPVPHGAGAQHYGNDFLSEPNGIDKPLISWGTFSFQTGIMFCTA